jgi:hypothetical protein
MALLVPTMAEKGGNRDAFCATTGAESADDGAEIPTLGARRPDAATFPVRRASWPRQEPS